MKAILLRVWWGGEEESNYESHPGSGKGTEVEDVGNGFFVIHRDGERIVINLNLARVVVWKEDK